MTVEVTSIFAAANGSFLRIFAEGSETKESGLADGLDVRLRGQRLVEQNANVSRGRSRRY